MNSSWIKVYIASFFEVLWVIGLKHSDSLVTWVMTLLFVFISFYLIITAGRRLPVGSMYAVFVGLGTAGAMVSEIIFFGEPIKLQKIILIIILLIGVIGLKQLSTSKKSEGVSV